MNRLPNGVKDQMDSQADNGLAIVIEYLEAEWTFREILQWKKISTSCQSD
jgi:hypothetical protein